MYIYIKPIFYFKKPNKRRVIRKDTQYGGNYAFKKKIGFFKMCNKLST